MEILVIIGILLVIFLAGSSKRNGSIWPWNSAKWIGDQGEAAVAWRLDKLSNDYTVFNDVLLVSGKYSTQIDHVVVSKYGIFVIETKNIHGKVYGSESSEYWKQYLPQMFYRYLGNQEFTLRNPIWQNNGHVKAMRRLLSDWNVPIIGIVAFSNDTDLNVSCNYPVMYMKDIVSYIKSQKTIYISEDDVVLISQRISSNNHRRIEERETHILNVHENKQRRDKMVSSGFCPLCGGNLKLRDGRYGRFYGCSNYPQCRYTHPAD